MRSPTSRPTTKYEKINRLSPRDLDRFRPGKRKLSDKRKAEMREYFRKYYQKNKEKLKQLYHENKIPTTKGIEKGLLSGNWSIDIHNVENEAAILEHRLRNIDKIVVKARIKSLSWLSRKTVDHFCVKARIKSLSWLKSKVAYRLAA